jgi:hypothetical protein
VIVPVPVKNTTHHANDPFLTTPAAPKLKPIADDLGSVKALSNNITSENVVDQVAQSRNSYGGVLVTVVFVCVGIAASLGFLWSTRKHSYQELANKKHDEELEMDHFRIADELEDPDVLEE